MAANQVSGERAGTGRFGTFTGVFTPNVLTILGIILFLRIGWVVGQAGLVNALSIVLLANAISLLTGFSVSAVATSMDVKAGGNYFLISRSLGLEIGGAIGIPLFLSQAISVAFYIIGLVEALRLIPFVDQFDPRLVATVCCLIFIVIAYVGADFALRIQYFILAALVLALISFFAGGWDSFIPVTTAPAYDEGLNYWAVFAVFFPAVTGIEVGTSLSGDLKDPSRSIPRGTLASILVTATVYLAVVIWFATHLPPTTLRENFQAMSEVALWPALIGIGVAAATFSSALGSVLAAPRTVEAIANDGVLPRWVAARLGSPTEPRMGVLITGLIALVVIWSGDLNFVATIISMFFLNTYGMINLAAGIERLVGNPSYRPSFRIPWYLSILGALGCYGAMFLISPGATIIAIVISYGFFFFLERRQIQRTWGDVQSGIWFAVARYALLQLEEQRWHAKNWRPNLIVFTGQPHNRQPLVEVAQWLSQGRGIVTFFQLMVGDIDQMANAGWRETARKNIQRYIREEELTAFAEAEVVADFVSGALTVVQAHGISGLEANSTLLGWSGTPAGRQTQMTLLRSLVHLNKNVLLLHHDDTRGFGQRRAINIWWKGRGANADLMLLLAYIIRQHPEWRQADIRLLRIIDH
ncbi:MAG: hypothetical protein KDE34_14480, partial [Anaerolineales bacterium]|nr:hypothetical protein [Anaerolineales bacterium]